jgi:hypothetical protein
MKLKDLLKKEGERREGKKKGNVHCNPTPPHSKKPSTE